MNLLFRWIWRKLIAPLLLLKFLATGRPAEAAQPDAADTDSRGGRLQQAIDADNGDDTPSSAQMAGGRRHPRQPTPVGRNPNAASAGSASNNNSNAVAEGNGSIGGMGMVVGHAAPPPHGAGVSGVGLINDDSSPRGPHGPSLHDLPDVVLEVGLGGGEGGGLHDAWQPMRASQAQAGLHGEGERRGEGMGAHKGGGSWLGCLDIVLEVRTHGVVRRGGGEGGRGEGGE